MAAREATNLACRAFSVQKSGRDDCVGGAEASALPTIPTASIKRVKCLDEHEFRKLLRFRREPSEESSGLPVDHVWGMVPEDPPKQARPPKQTLLRGLLLPQPDKGDLQPRSKSGMWEKVRGMQAWAASRLRRRCCKSSPGRGSPSRLKRRSPLCSLAVWPTCDGFVWSHQ
ncbi:unnamed protein product, partial [Symbiodinium necroappetens]